MTDPAPASPADRPQSWYAQPTLTGRLVTLTPLTIEHAPGLHTALWCDDAAHKVYQWLGAPPPETIEQTRELIYTALAQRSTGRRLPYVQLDSETGSVVGTTSFYDIEPSVRTIAIGWTWLGRRWWRTGFNTEAKLLMLDYAFSELGAARIVWHTDVRNARSRAAIQRLGATFEGELRKHRILADHTWRTTAQFSMVDDDWAACRERLRAALNR